MKQKVLFTLFAMVSVLGICGIVYADTPDRDLFRTTYGSSAIASSCAVCHTSAPALNPYGAAYRSNGRNAAALTTIASLDSDGDGFTNIVEINAGFFPGDAANRPATTADTTGPTLAITSHTNGQSVTTASITLSGTATDSGRGNSGIQQVMVNGVAATGGTATTSATASWSRAVTLNAGANTITVIASDNSTAGIPPPRPLGSLIMLLSQTR